MNPVSGAHEAGWEPTGWWRALLADGTLWCESSDESEVREHASRRVGTTVQRHMRRVEERWESAPENDEQEGHAMTITPGGMPVGLDGRWHSLLPEPGPALP